VRASEAEFESESPIEFDIFVGFKGNGSWFGNNYGIATSREILVTKSDK
jgi:hypothetical protein